MHQSVFAVKEYQEYANLNELCNMRYLRKNNNVYGAHEFK